MSSKRFLEDGDDAVQRGDGVEMNAPSLAQLHETSDGHIVLQHSSAITSDVSGIHIDQNRAILSAENSDGISMDSIDVVMAANNNNKAGNSNATSVDVAPLRGSTKNPSPPTAVAAATAGAPDEASTPLIPPESAHRSEFTAACDDVITELPKDEIVLANAIVVTLTQSAMVNAPSYKWDDGFNQCYLPEWPATMMADLLQRNSVGGSLTRREALALMQWFGRTSINADAAERFIVNFRANTSGSSSIANGMSNKSGVYAAPTLPMAEGERARNAHAPDFNSSMGAAQSDCGGSNSTLNKLNKREDLSSVSTVPYHPIIGVPVRSNWVTYPLLRATTEVAPTAEGKAAGVAGVDAVQHHHATLAVEPTHANTGPVEWDPFFGPPVRKRACAGGKAGGITTLADPQSKQLWLNEKMAQLERR